GYVNQTPGKFYVPGALGQIELFRIALKGKKPQARALYIIWTGGNDYITGATEPADVVANISKAVETLYSLGARNFLVPNLPDLGMAPLIQPNGQEFSLLTKSHNTLLAKARNEWVARLRGVNIALVDVYAVTQNLFKAGVIVTGPPALELIAGGTGAVSCLFTNPAACPDVNLAAVIPPVYFWDVLHPTTLVHGHYGQAMFNSRP
ncbi:MAG TPA: SGNH/GDSL hydrolase family protein, partial [Nitrosospira sp.]